MPSNQVVAEGGADITLASTTETQAELDHATSDKWREHFTPAADDGKKKDEKPGEAEKKATKTEASSDLAKTEAKTGKEKDEDDEEDLPPGAKKRIDKLTARWKAAQDEIAALRKGEKTPSARETVQPAKAAANADPEPQEKDFKTWDEWNAAHNRWVVRDEQRTLAAKEEQDRAQAEAKETYDGHLSRIQSFAAEHDDFEESVKDMASFTFAGPHSNMAFQMAIVEADNGPEIMYHLAKNPEEMAKFEGLSPVKVQMLIGRLSAKLAPESSTADDDEKKDAAAAAASTTQKSKAPPPGTAVRRSTAAPATALDDPKMDTDEWMRKRNEQERKNRRR